ncbi:hypothetical protein AQUCO_01300933v1 [Aquilegia coerulea]|uniref:DYW domain-containing protein n=1 Tax=Aquilegia coerulea TaxID=218851 RepID=A0A2G5E463_AQUCA|nr:hypothetical protein AQUCO_01300933v1 [Aquilegia coerulea]
MSTITQTILPISSRQNPFTAHHHLLLIALNSATTLTHLKQIHAQILKTTDNSTTLFLKLFQSSTSLSSSSLDYALSVFNQTPNLESRLCNGVLRDLSKSNEPYKTLWVYDKMRRREDIGVDRYSFSPILKASARTCAVKEGMEIHGVASKLGFDLDPYVQTGLVGMYVAFGCVLEARLLFDKMLHKDIVTWNVMIDGYCQSGLYEDVLLLFEEMQSSGVELDKMLLCTILSACSRSGNLSSGKAIHDYVSQKNIVMDSHLLHSLIVMYSNCGSMDLAQYLYSKMTPKNRIASTAMIRGYSKLGKLEAARSIFNEMVEKDLVCWSVMISGYAESDWPMEAFKLFNDMQLSGLRPDQITMFSIISACAQLGALDKARWVHLFIDKNGFGDVLSINNALIDMYAKCGSLENASGVFNKIPHWKRNVISWTSMISGVAMHGDANTALGLFDQMKADGIEPNSVTFVNVLYSCSHAGFVEKGRQIFASMTNEYNIVPNKEHYGCMVDLLGRANLLREAFDLIESMPFTPNVVVWSSLLSACRVHGEVELGELAAKRLLELDPEHDGAHVLLSNIYAKAKRWKDVGAVRNDMKNKGIAKEKGCSRIEVNGEIHEFLMLDKMHKLADEIYDKLDEVVSKLKLVGYAPNISSVLVNLDDEEKKEVILWHSEKLALCYGLMSMEKESCIRIVKNL